MAKYDSRTSRSFAFDNDILVPGSRDQDYTYGLNLTFAGVGSERSLGFGTCSSWLARPDRLDLQHWLQTRFAPVRLNTVYLVFTPEEISLSAAGEW